jgi:hypothetical protein
MKLIMIGLVSCLSLLLVEYVEASPRHSYSRNNGRCTTTCHRVCKTKWERRCRTHTRWYGSVERRHKVCRRVPVESCRNHCSTSCRPKHRHHRSSQR